MALVATLSGCSALPPQPQPRLVSAAQSTTRTPYAPTHVSAFFEALSFYGSWHAVGLTWRWRPSDKTFAPFTRGAWVLTEYGPTWVSRAPFGWAVEHYGRWSYDDAGWAWLPDTEWSPAHVTWRQGARVIGWAPAMVAEEGTGDPAILWRFATNDTFFAALRANDGATPAPLEDPRYSAWYLAHSRALARWAQSARGELIAIGGELRPFATLEASATRWQPAWARERVTSRVLPAPRGTRLRGTEAPRKERAPLIQRPSTERD